MCERTSPTAERVASKRKERNKRIMMDRRTDDKTYEQTNTPDNRKNGPVFVICEGHLSSSSLWYAAFNIKT